MNYRELSLKVLDAFYKNGKSSPRNLLYPILSKNAKNKPVDVFLSCIIKRDNTGAIIKFLGPLDVCLYTVDSGEILFDNTPRKEKSFDYSFTNIRHVTVDEFIEAYMIIRNIAFQETTSNEQKTNIKTIISFYDNFCEKEISDIYHSYGQPFFEWAKSQLIDR